MISGTALQLPDKGSDRNPVSPVKRPWHRSSLGQKKSSTTSTMDYASAQANPTVWLTAVLLDLLEQNTEESKAALMSAIQTLVNYLEPGLIDQAFAPWIAHYTELLAQSENNQSTFVQLCLPLDLLEQQGELEIVDE